MDVNKVFDQLKEKRITHLSTVTEEGEPRVRPFAIAHVDDKGIFFFTGAFKEVYEQMINNPLVEISTISGPTISIRVRGTVSPVNDERIWKEVSDLNPDIVNLYKDNIDSLKLFNMAHGHVNYLDLSSGSLTPMVLKF